MWEQERSHGRGETGCSSSASSLRAPAHLDKDHALDGQQDLEQAAAVGVPLARLITTMPRAQQRQAHLAICSSSSSTYSSSSSSDDLEAPCWTSCKNPANKVPA